MATEETEDVIDDDEEEDSYSESEEPWDGPYRDPDDSYDPNWDTDADSDELELREVVTRALMEELEDEDDGLDSDDREFIDSMNPVPGNSIQSDCSCRSGQGLCILFCSHLIKCKCNTLRPTATLIYNLAGLKVQSKM